MDIDTLNAFLRASKSAAVSTSPSAPKVTLVIGNEAADLDSMVCAVSYALTVSREKTDNNNDNDDDDAVDAVAVVPMIGVPREDFALRTDAAWLFAQVGVDVDALTFSDDVDPLALDAAGRLSELILVDHNVPSTSLSSLAPKITRVIDHHEDESKYPPTAAVEIVLLGSCATLVTEAIIAATLTEADASAAADDEEHENENENENEEGKATPSGGGAAGVLVRGGPVAKMLAAAVLLDTQNLDPSATRWEGTHSCIHMIFLHSCVNDANLTLD